MHTFSTIRMLQEPPVGPPASGSWVTAVRQHCGLVTAATACAATLYFYDQEDPLMVWKVLAWMFVAFIGLGMHEFRPKQWNS